MSFGTYLVQARELRGLERGEVAAKTKIPESTLEALETDAESRLPERVYVMGYLRAYADAVGLDPDEVALRFEEANPEAAEEADAAPEVVTTERPGAALLAIFGVGAVILAVVAFLLFGR